VEGIGPVNCTGATARTPCAILAVMSPIRAQPSQILKYLPRLNP
jgi:hypothetical protein